jgi:hypothetical protein
MSSIGDLDRILEETGKDAFGARTQFAKDTVPSDVTDNLLYGILKALVVIGKILTGKS